MNTEFQVKYGPWAIVTGASSGIGEAFAHALARRGVPSILVARRIEQLHRVAAEVKAATGVECDCKALDIGDPGFADSLLRHYENREIGLVVSNAGYNPAGAFAERSRDEMLQILNVNDRAPLLLAHAFLPKLAARGRGGFLITGSVEGFFGAPYSAVYSASKAFVQSFGEALWGEYKPLGVDVLVLSPGATDTPLLATRNLGKVPGMMSAAAVAEVGLDRLAHGPGVVPGGFNRAMVRIMTWLPRRMAVRSLGSNMKTVIARAKRPMG